MYRRTENLSKNIPVVFYPETIGQTPPHISAGHIFMRSRQGGKVFRISLRKEVERDQNNVFSEGCKKRFSIIK